MRPTWQNAKHLLQEYDGAATEIFLVGLPFSHLHIVVAALANLRALEVVDFDGASLDTAEPFNANWRSRFESPPSVSCQHSLRSAYGTAEHLQIYLWAHVNNKTLELELVFWNYMTFPRGLEAEEYEKRLQSLVALVETCRVGAPGARCVLAPEHNGPVEELLSNDRVIAW